MHNKKTYLALSSLMLLALLILVVVTPQRPVTLEDVVRPVLIDTLPVIEHIWHKASVSLADYNNDGLVDVFVTTNARGHLYKNKGGSFERVSDEGSGSAFEHVHMGLWGDVDNDGCKDLFVTRQSEYSYGFYKNNCDGTFTDEGARINPSVSVNGYGASFIDFDNDGLLDVFAVSFDRDDHRNFSSYALESGGSSNMREVFNPVVYKENNVLLLQKDGALVRSLPSDSVLSGDLFGSRACAEANGISREAGRRLGPKFGFKQAYQPVWFDADLDGLLDVLVTYDFGFSALYRQTAPGDFEDVTYTAGLCKLGNAMGVAVGDIDNDGDFDIYETNIGSNYLFVNSGKGTFEERGAEAGVIDYSNSGWGTSFADFNNDTLLDIVVSNGREVAPTWPYDEMDKIFLNKGKERFSEIPVDHRALFALELDEKEIFNADAAAATGDLNNDGFPDAVIFRPHTGALYVLFGKPNGNHWLSISLKGTTNNREGIGATIVVESGGVRQARVVTAGTSYLSQDDTRQLFGLGKHEYVDTVEVSWSNGAFDVYRGITADQHIELKEGSGE